MAGAATAAASTTKQDAVLTALLPPGYDKAKADALKIIATGSNTAHRVNTFFVTLAVMLREGGSPGAARAAGELKTSRRVRRVPISETDANPYRILQTGMVAVGPQDYYKEVKDAKDNELALADSTSAPDSGTDGDATVAEATTDAPVAPGADGDDDEGGSSLQEFRRRLDAISPDRP